MIITNMRDAVTVLERREICMSQNDVLISRAAAIDTIRHVTCSFRLKSDINFENYREEIQEIFNHIRDAQDRALNELPSAESHNKLAKIANLVEGTIDHFDRDDAMDLLYQIKDVLK